MTWLCQAFKASFGRPAATLVEATRAAICRMSILPELSDKKSNEFQIEIVDLVRKWNESIYKPPYPHIPIRIMDLIIQGYRTHGDIQVLIGYSSPLCLYRLSCMTGLVTDETWSEWSDRHIYDCRSAEIFIKYASDTPHDRTSLKNTPAYRKAIAMSVQDS